MNAALNPPRSTGTSPHDEIGAMQHDDNGQRDHNESVMPAEDRIQQLDSLPEGFRYQPVYQNGKQVFEDKKGTIPKMSIKPTLSAIRDLADLTQEFLDAKELRRDEVGEDEKLCKLLDQLTANLGQANQYLGGSGVAYSMERQYTPQLAGALRWVDIHAKNIQRHEANGNEDAAESSLANLESSRSQALKIASILDWCEDSGANINVQKAVEQCLGLAAWSLQNSGAGQHRRAVSTTTRDMLFNGRVRQPDEVAEREEEESATI